MNLRAITLEPPSQETLDQETLNRETTAYLRILPLQERLAVEALQQSSKEEAEKQIQLTEAACLSSLAFWRNGKLLCQTTEHRPRAFMSAINRLESRRIIMQDIRANVESPQSGTLGERLCMVEHMKIRMNILGEIDATIQDLHNVIHKLTADHTLIDCFIEMCINEWEHDLKLSYAFKKEINERGLDDWWCQWRMEAAAFTARQNHEMFMLAEREERSRRGPFSALSRTSQPSISEDDLRRALDLILAEDDQVNKIIAGRYNISD
ncbi:hypothetical protein N7451_011280 [Penicillium sp. IBT 35674x]|nr:hypothetical protein N7451_011280 [Penicillium sp. IBT 35674x]